MVAKQGIDARKALESAFGNLAILPEKSVTLKSAIDCLLAIDTKGPGTRLPNFTVDDSKILNELDQMEMLSTTLADHIDKMHQSAIVTMLHWKRPELVKQLRASAKIARAAHRVEVTRLIALDESSRPKPSKGGRPEKLRALAVSQIVAYYYLLLTGKKPTLRHDPYSDNPDPCGHFFALLKAVFNTLSLKESVEHFARMAIQSFKEDTSQE